MARERPDFVLKCEEVVLRQENFTAKLVPSEASGIGVTYRVSLDQPILLTGANPPVFQPGQKYVVRVIEEP